MHSLAKYGSILGATLIYIYMCSGAQASVLSDAIDVLPAKTWGQMPANATISVLENYIDSTYYWANTAAWDDDNNRLIWVGAPGSCCTSDLTYRQVIYDVSTDTWSVQNTPFFKNGHGYDASAYGNNTFYFALGNQSKVQTWNGASWSTTSNLPWQLDIAPAATYFPEADGLFVLSGINGQAAIQNASGGWSTISGVSWGGIHPFAEYNRKHGVVWFGAGNGSNATARLNADLSVDQLQTLPFAARTSDAFHVEDPVSGRYIVADRNSNNWYEFDVMTNTLNTISGMQNAPTIRESMVVGSLPEHGAIMLFDGGNGTAYVYKHEVDSNPAPNVNLSASQTTVNNGDDVILSWSTSNATSCNANGGWSGSRATSGSETINNLTVTDTYTLNCSGPGGSNGDSVTVTVNSSNPAPIVNLSASPTSVSTNMSSTLTWTVSNATSCTASGDWSGSKSVSGGTQSTGALTSNASYTLSCIGSGGSDSDSASVTVTAGNPGDADADWIARSTAAGVTMATRFNTEAEVLDHVLQNSTAGNVSWTTNLKTSGNGALRFELLSTDTTGHGDWHRFMHEGDAPTQGGFTTFESGDEFYVQFRQYIPEFLATYNWDTNSGNGTGFKQSIISSYSNSNTPFEVVLTSTSRGYAQAYHREGETTGLSLHESVFTACNPSDFKHQNAIDRGANPLTGLSPNGDAWTACEQDRARYGGLYSYVSSGGERGPIDPISGAVPYPKDGWMTFLQRIKLNSSYNGIADNEIDIWAAPDGEDYTLIMTSDTVEFGPKNTGSTGLVEGFTAVTLLPYTSDGLANPNRPNTFTVYDEVIVSTAFIPAPGFSADGPVDPEPNVILNANPLSIMVGETTTLIWSSTDADSCLASGAGWSGDKATSDSQTISGLSADTTFILTCTGDGGSDSDSVTVEVTEAVVPEPEVSLTANAETIDSGDDVTLSWVVKNAVLCRASNSDGNAVPWFGTKASDGGTEVISNVTVATSYALACTNSEGVFLSDAVNVAVNGVATPSVSLTATPNPVLTGDDVTLSWASTNATSCVASEGWTGPKVINGSETIENVTQSQSYVLTCTNDNGDGASDVVSVMVSNVGVPTVSLVATPDAIDSGGYSTLVWSSSDATSCTASGGWNGVQSLNGSQLIGALSATDDYTLSCSGVGGNASTTVTVTVSDHLTVTPAEDSGGGAMGLWMLLWLQGMWLLYRRHAILK